MFHFHNWSSWKTIEAFVGEFVWGGGRANVVIQQRVCSKCAKIELNRQIA